MKVKCILSHEKPMGKLFKAGKVYELDEFESRYFVPIGDEEKKEEKKGQKERMNNK